MISENYIQGQITGILNVRKKNIKNLNIDSDKDKLLNETNKIKDLDLVLELLEGEYVEDSIRNTYYINRVLKNILKQLDYKKTKLYERYVVVLDNKTKALIKDKTTKINHNDKHIDLVEKELRLVNSLISKLLNLITYINKADYYRKRA